MKASFCVISNVNFPLVQVAKAEYMEVEDNVYDDLPHLNGQLLEMDVVDIS